MRRVAVVAAGPTPWSGSVLAGLAERHDTVALRAHGRIWHLGRQPLGETPAASLAAAVALLATADVALPLAADPQIAALCALAGLPIAGSGPAATVLGRDWWASRLLALDAGVDVAPGVRVTRGLARGLDYLGPVEVRPATRAPVPCRTRVTSAPELPLALERAFTYADHAVVEEALDGERVTVGILRRADGAALVSPPYRELTAAADRSSRTGEIPVRAGRGPGGGGRTGTRPPLGGPAPAGRHDDPAGVAGVAAGPAVLTHLDPAARRRIDHDALTVLDALGASGALTVDFVLAGSGPVLDDVDLAPALGPHDPVPRMFAAAGTGYPALLDALVGSAR